MYYMKIYIYTYIIYIYTYYIWLKHTPRIPASPPKKSHDHIGVFSHLLCSHQTAYGSHTILLQVGDSPRSPAPMAGEFLGWWDFDVLNVWPENLTSLPWNHGGWKTNYFPFWNGPFSGGMLIFRGGTSWFPLQLPSPYIKITYVIGIIGVMLLWKSFADTFSGTSYNVETSWQKWCVMFCVFF